MLARCHLLDRSTTHQHLQNQMNLENTVFDYVKVKLKHFVNQKVQQGAKNHVNRMPVYV